MLTGIFPVLVKYNISFNFSAEMQYIIAFTQPVIIHAVLEVAGYTPADYTVVNNSDNK